MSGNDVTEVDHAAIERCRRAEETAARDLQDQRASGGVPTERAYHVVRLSLTEDATLRRLCELLDAPPETILRRGLQLVHLHSRGLLPDPPG